MKKVTDLRREVKERLSLKGVVDLTAYQLKPIDITKNPTHINKTFGNRMGKIGAGLIKETMDLNCSAEDMVNKIERLISKGSLKLTINTTENEGVKKLIKSFNKGEFIKETSIIATISMKEESFICYTSLDFIPTASQEGVFSFRDYVDKKKYGKISFMSFAKMIGTVHFFNSLEDYFSKNEKMAKVLLMRYINNEGLYTTSDQYHQIKSSLKDEGYITKDGNVRILKDIYSEKQYDSMVSRKDLSHLLWDSSKDYYKHLAEIFYQNSGSYEYQPTQIKNEKLTAYFFNILYELNKEEENDVKTEISDASDYARSYETKKNIPEKVKLKMKNNNFTKHFGYVEFDELVDLDKIDLIEKEWKEINDKILLPISKDHSLRFRRLGNHKAAGLYFPAMKAVCVDIKQPSSMIHEVMHMIDYTSLTSTNLSSMYNFRSIIERYREVTDKKIDKLPDSNSYKEIWNGKTKYNKSYFHSAKEIFARCGEIYIEKILGIETSLIDTSPLEIYPSDDDFLVELIKKYYESIIQIATDKKENETEKIAKYIPSIKKTINLEDSIQINLFNLVEGM